MKELCLESRLKRKTRVCLPDAPGQGIPLGRGDIPEGLPDMWLCFTVPGPRNSKKSFCLFSSQHWNQLLCNGSDADCVHAKSLAVGFYLWVVSARLIHRFLLVPASLSRHFQIYVKRCNEGRAFLCGVGQSIFLRDVSY